MPASVRTKDHFIWIFLGLTAALWVASFWAFLSRQTPIISDAVSFYDHLKFYADNVSRGVYPLWDPLWSCGSPNEFFLRRIGPFNPFLFLIIVPYKLGLDYWAVFAAFITFYYFLGMTGFYRLAKEIVGDAKVALTAFFLLSFSSLGTRVFDSYVMMIMTPMIWFFYFALIFGRRGSRAALLGMVFCVMLLMTTYIPFYFLVLLISGVVFFIPVFPKQSWDFVLRLGRFGKQNPALTFICLMALVLVCLPGFLFFKSAGQGTFTMPLRHFDAVDTHALSVKTDVVTYWAIPEDLMFSSFYLEDLRLFDFAVFYVPLFGAILFWLGAATRLRRKTAFLILWGIFLLAMGSPYVFPLYGFLSQHIFFFKYFRNLHFFLWFAVLPMFILLICDQFGVLLKFVEQHPRHKRRAFALIVLVHAALAGYLVWRQSAQAATWAVLIVSFIFFMSAVRARLNIWVFCFLCFFGVATEPFITFHYFAEKAPQGVSLSAYDLFKYDFKYTRGERVKSSFDENSRSVSSEAKTNPIYFGSQWFNALWERIDYTVLNNYTFAKFILYDRVQIFDEQKEDMRILELSLAHNSNVAFVPSGTSADVLASDGAAVSPSALIVEQGSELLKVVSSDANKIRIETHLPAKKFLVFNDCYYPGWEAYINGKPVGLYRANMAFKGIWVPAGKQEVEFRFGGAWRYKLEPFLVVFYLFFFIIMCYIWRRDARIKGTGHG